MQSLIPCGAGFLAKKIKKNVTFVYSLLFLSMLQIKYFFRKLHGLIHTSNISQCFFPSFSFDDISVSHVQWVHSLRISFSSTFWWLDFTTNQIDCVDYIRQIDRLREKLTTASFFSDIVIYLLLNFQIPLVIYEQQFKIFFKIVT